MRAETACSDGAFEVSFVGAPRDDVDHAADRVGAEQCRAGALDDFDTLDEFRCNILDCGAADGAGVDADTVNEHERMIALGAPQEQ